MAGFDASGVLWVITFGCHGGSACYLLKDDVALYRTVHHVDVIAAPDNVAYIALQCCTYTLFLQRELQKMVR